MRWGIIGTGTIATQFMGDIRQYREAKAVAVYSRSYEKTRKFAETWGIEKDCASLDELLADPGVENVYIATPNNLHKEYILRCAAAKKNILCEKPMGINRGEVETMLAAAREHGVLLMEGMWTRFFPVMGTLRRWLRDGSIGKVRAAEISLGYNAIKAGETATWRFDLKSGFGALMDMGVYGVHFALDLCPGEAPSEVYGAASVVDGIDHHNSFTLNFGGKIVTVVSSIVNDTDLAARIYTDQAEITVAAPWWYSKELTVSMMNGEKAVFSAPRDGEGLQYEVRAFEECAMARGTECPLSSHANSIAAIDIMDRLRKSWGVNYPQDK